MDNMQDGLDTFNSAPVASEQPQEQTAQQKMLAQDEVNKIVSREKARAAESARREIEAKYQREMEQLNALRMQQEQRNAEVPRDTDSNAMYQQVQEMFNREMQAHQAKIQEQQTRDQMTQVANSYLQKVEEAKKSYNDYDEVTKDFDPTAFPQLTYLLSGIPDAGHALYDLSKNPLKLAALDRLAEKNPRQAQNELLKLANSISANRQAQSDAQNQNVSEPLDRLQSSRVSGSNGKMGIRDLRNQPWLRG